MPEVAHQDVDLFARIRRPGGPSAGRTGPAGDGRGRLAEPRPPAESGLHQGLQLPRVEVADGHEEGLVGPEVAAVVVDDVVAGQPGDLPGGPPGVAGIGVVAVDEPAEEEVGAKGGVVAVGLEFGGDLAAGPGEGIGREGRADGQVGQPLDGHRQVLGPDPERGAGRADLERPADVLDRLGHRLGRPRGRSLPRASGRSGRPVPAWPRGAARRRRTAPGPPRPSPGLGSVRSRMPLGRVTSGGVVGQLVGPAGISRSIGRGDGGGRRGGGPPGAGLGRQQDRHRSGRPGDRPADGEVGLEQVGRGDPADVLGLDRRARRDARPARPASRR